MKLRMLAMATVAAAALSTPAMAGDGWYLGLGGGYDQQNGYRLQSVPAPGILNNKINAKDSAIGVVSVGYKWDEGWRLENEFAFTQHDTSLNGTGSFAATGGSQISSDMINLLYDIPLGDTWKFTIGGGVGIGGFRGALRTNGTSFDLFRGGHSAFQWQGIAGLSVSVAPDVDLFGEYRYRENETNGLFASSYTPLTPVRISAVSENVALFGLRWFMTPPGGGPPPPAPASPASPASAASSSAASPAAAGEDVHRLLRL
jgi:opacity protein-like surface antigen